MRTYILLLVFVMGGWMALGGVAAAEDAATDAAALAKQIQNPLAAMVTLPMQANYNLGVGQYDRTFYNLNVQPVIPFRGEDWNVIVRTIIPINSVPVDETGSIFGMGDANLGIYWSPAKSGSFTWGLGPVFNLPTASNPEAMGSGTLGVGPTGILFYQVGRWTMGGVANNIWSVAREKNRNHYNVLVCQYFLNFNFGGGVAIGTAPILSANWMAESGQQWTVPWGLQLSKVTRFGSRPVNLLVGYYYNSEHPDDAAEEQVRIQVNFLYPMGAK